MREIATIAVRHRGKDVSAVARTFERDLRDPREVFANRISVLGVSRAEFVKINLLIKIQISFGPLTLPGKTRVINSSAVSVPGRTAARCGILHVRDGVRQRFSRRGFVKVKRAVLASAFRQRDSDVLAIK